MRSPFAIAAISFALTGAVLLSGAPAQARGASTDYRCTALAEQARTAAATVADANQQARVRRMISTGDSLCQARAEGEAARQFRAALQVMGVQEVRAAANPAEIAAR